MAVVIDHDGVAAILKSDEVRAALLSLGNDVASRVDATSHGESVPIKVGTYTTDRAAVGVTIAHPAGLAIEAKHGSLVRAASATGLEVKALK